MKTIALIGNSNSGKTSTLNFLLIKLLKEGYHKELLEQIGANIDDFKCILVKDGVKVGIATVGDFNVQKPDFTKTEIKEGCRTFKEYIDEFKLNGCHKSIIAISDDCNTLEEIENNLPTFSYKVVKKGTNNPNLQETFNKNDVKTILVLLNS